ncbi:MAG TPA: phosphoribosylamine--glycine ligase, partial [Quisquiliibacterium sp.]|nr:phosphoribosylamine--glycine ligase [Quisquiliibacterium sp.]
TFTDAAAAHAYVDRRGAPIVIKADGLAAGKGVVVATSLDEAHQAIDAMLIDNRMGAAGARVVIEDFLAGEEASFIVLVDGRNVLTLASSQDHKRLRDNDQGPNTGGMGAYSPAPVVTPAIDARVMREIIMPTVNGMTRDGIPFTGFLYAGLMIDDTGQPRTLEFNCRMGDPETQPIMARIKSDLAAVFEKAIDGKLDEAEITWDRRTALGVVLAAHGYPDDPRKGDLINGLPANGNDADADCLVFHAGTYDKDGQIYSNGGRVLCVTGLGDSVKMAQTRAYQGVDTIHFAGMQCRRDIGFRAIARKRPDGA